MFMSKRFNFFVKNKVCDKIEKKIEKDKEMSWKFSLAEEEKLCQLDRLYPIIHDKLHKSY